MMKKVEKKFELEEEVEKQVEVLRTTIETLKGSNIPNLELTDRLKLLFSLRSMIEFQVTFRNLKSGVKYSQDVVKVLLNSKTPLNHLPPQYQFDFLFTILLSSKFLYYSDDPENEVCGLQDGISKIFRPGAEKRVEGVRNILENPTYSSLLKISRNQKNELLVFTYRLLSRFYRWKKRLDFLKHAMKFAKKAERHALRMTDESTRNKNHFLSLTEIAAVHMEFCYQYEFAKVFKMLENSNERQTSEDPTQLCPDQNLSFEEIKRTKDGHANSAIEVFEKYLMKKQDLEKIGCSLTTPDSDFWMLFYYGKALYFKSDLESALKYMNMVESDIYRVRGQNYPFVLGNLYKTKYQIFNKLGDPKKAEQMLKKYRKLCDSGNCYGFVPDKYNPLRQYVVGRGTAFQFNAGQMLEESVDLFRFGSYSGVKVEKEVMKVDRKVRRCSNAICLKKAKKIN